MAASNNGQAQYRTLATSIVLIAIAFAGVWLFANRDRNMVENRDVNRNQRDVASSDSHESPIEGGAQSASAWDPETVADVRSQPLALIRRGYISGHLVDENGERIPFVFGQRLPIELRPVSGAINEGRPLFSTLGRKGSFSFSEIPIGTYDVFVGRSEATGFRSRAKSATQVSITKKANVAYVKVPFSKKPAFSGMVTDAAGNPVGNAVIEFYSKNSNQLLTSRSNLVGKFQVYDIPKHTATVIAWHPAHSPSKRVRFLKNRGSLTLRLAPGATVEGIVVDDQTNSPIREFFLESGTFKFFGDDGSGRFHGTGDSTRTHRLHTRAKGYLSIETSLPALSPGERNTNIVVRLTPIGTSTISGRVVDESGSGLSGVQLKFSREGPQSVQRGTFIVREIEFYTDDDGRFSVELASDYYKVTTTHYGYATTQQRVLIDAAATDIGDIKLSLGAELHCRAPFPNPGSSDIDILTFPDEKKILSKMTVENGTYVFRQITPGKVLLRIRGPFTFTKPVVARAGEITQVDIDLPMGSTHVEGYVAPKDRDRFSPHKMSISMRRKLPDGGTIEFRRTVKPDGFYSFPSVSPGEYDVEITKEIARYNPNGFATEDTIIVHRETIRLSQKDYFRQDFTPSM